MNKQKETTEKKEQKTSFLSFFVFSSLLFPFPLKDNKINSIERMEMRKGSIKGKEVELVEEMIKLRNKMFYWEIAGFNGYKSCK